MPKTKVLVVDDEPIVRNLCAAVLRANGFDSIVAANGVEGLEIYRERHEEINLVITDAAMPQMNGFDMVLGILELDVRANVILMSGFNLRGVIPGELVGPCAWMAKPFTRARLIEEVKKYVGGDRLSGVTGGSPSTTVM
jgi:DNA-binding NtrC family response regulator